MAQAVPAAKRAKGPNPLVYFDIALGGNPAGRIVMEVRIWSSEGGAVQGGRSGRKYERS